jgi:hypothetical protein
MSHSKAARALGIYPKRKPKFTFRQGFGRAKPFEQASFFSRIHVLNATADFLEADAICFVDTKTNQLVIAERPFIDNTNPYVSVKLVLGSLERFLKVLLPLFDRLDFHKTTCLLHALSLALPPPPAPQEAKEQETDAAAPALAFAKVVHSFLILKNRLFRERVAAATHRLSPILEDNYDQRERARLIIVKHFKESIPVY